MKIFKLWFPVIVWAGIIFYCSSMPDLKTDLEEDFVLRKIAHVFEYFILTFLLYRAFKGSFNINGLYLFVWPSVLSFLYAASDEFHQTFVPGRHGCVRDVLIDAAGILGVYIALRVFAANKRKISIMG